MDDLNKEMETFIEELIAANPDYLFRKCNVPIKPFKFQILLKKKMVP
jgi:hypothetical protein